MKQTQTNKIEWREVALGDKTNFELIMGQSPAGESYNSEGKGTPFFQGKAEFTDKHPTIKKWTSEPSKLAEPNSILMSIRAPVGDVNICNVKCCIGRGLASIKPKKEVSFSYLFYYFLLVKEKIANLGTGSTFKAINSKQLANIKLPLPFLNNQPSLAEQERIVSILEKAEKLKERGKNAEALLNEYLKSVFNEMFLNKGFEVREINAGLIKTENINPEIAFKDKNFNYIDIASIDNITKTIVNTKLILGQDAPSRARQLVKHKDVLISTVRPNLNAVALVSKLADNQVCSTGFCILRADNKTFIPEYLFYTSKTNSFINSLVNRCTGANYPAVSCSDVKSLKIPLPPLALQQKFASIVEQVEKMKENVRKTKTSSEELFNSLMQKAFRGEL